MHSRRSPIRTVRRATLCGRYVSPDDAAIERESTLVRTEWQCPASYTVAPSRVRTLIQLVFFNSLLLLMLGCAPGLHPPQPPRPPPITAGTWLVLLCKASDAPVEPHPISYYQTLFSKDQNDLLFAFFDSTTNHKVKLSAEVHNWVSMPVDSAMLQARNSSPTAHANRSATSQDCEAAALAALNRGGVNIDLSAYQGIISVINILVDSGYTSGNRVVVGTDFDPSFWEHEMIHALGFPKHSWRTGPDNTTDHVWNHAPDTEYNDCWDIMSWFSCAVSSSFPTPFGRQGPELEAYYRDWLNWLPPGRVTHVSQSTTITMAPISDPSRPGPLLVIVDLPGGQTYGLEYAQPTGFDRGIPFPLVTIRELRGGLSFLTFSNIGRTGWQAGELFTDSGDHLSIHVDALAIGRAQLTINTKYSLPRPSCVDVPDVTDSITANAVEIVKNVGFVAKVVSRAGTQPGAQTHVYAQSPNPGECKNKGFTVILKVESGPIN